MGQLGFFDDLEKADREMKKLIQAIKDGVPGSVVKDETQVLEVRRKEMTHTLENAPASCHDFTLIWLRYTTTKLPSLRKPSTMKIAGPKLPRPFVH
jgi:hypothetical protein